MLRRNPLRGVHTPVAQAIAAAAAAAAGRSESADPQRGAVDEVLGVTCSLGVHRGAVGRFNGDHSLRRALLYAGRDARASLGLHQCVDDDNDDSNLVDSRCTAQRRAHDFELQRSSL